MSKLIVNVETGEVIERELNKAEKDQQKLDEALIAKIEAETKAEIETKIQAKAALLAKLGLSEDEAKLLFG